MKVKKSVKKAQSGGKRADSLVTERKLMPKFIDLERERVKGPSDKIDTAARKKAIKDGKFYEDPKTGDLFPVKKKAASGKKMAKAKSGAALKKQAAKAIAMKKAGKAPKKSMKMGGKCKYGC